MRDCREALWNRTGDSVWTQKRPKGNPVRGLYSQSEYCTQSSLSQRKADPRPGPQVRQQGGLLVPQMAVRGRWNRLLSYPWLWGYRIEGKEHRVAKRCPSPSPAIRNPLANHRECPPNQEGREHTKVRDQDRLRLTQETGKARSTR